MVRRTLAITVCLFEVLVSVFPRTDARCLSRLCVACRFHTKCTHEGS